jgi:hypothetical protein
MAMLCVLNGKVSGSFTSKKQNIDPKEFEEA